MPVRLTITRLATAVVFLLLASPVTTKAQPAGKLYRIGLLGPHSPSILPLPIAAFRQGLRELGYVEGQNIVIEFRDAGGKVEQLPDVAAELVRLKVDVIVARGTQAIMAAKKATGTIPIIMSVSGDAVGTGLVASLARPGGNVTGLTYIAPELSGKRLELIKEVIRGVTKVAVLWNPADPPRRLELQETESAAQRLGLKILPLGVRTLEDLDRRFSTMAEEGAKALVVFLDPLTQAHRARIANRAVRLGLPSVYAASEFAEAGGLMSYGANFSDLYRRAATYVDKILKGAKPADLPVEQPTKFELIINLKTAKALGLTIPPVLLLRADEVIQ